VTGDHEVAAASALAEPLLDAPLRDPSGRVTSLRRELGRAATVVVFLRHFG
jgi:hypothetical protein